MNDKLKDTDLREALHRKYGDTPKLPADFMVSMEQRLYAKPMQARRTTIGWLLRAACLLIIIGVGAVLLMKEEKSPLSETQVAVVTPHTDLVQQPSADSVVPQSPSPANAKPVRHQRTVRRVRTQDAPQCIPPTMTDSNLHYASIETQKDSVPYQDPARVDEFIAKLAELNEVKAVPLDCAADPNDSTVVSTAYVFEDREELDLFARLLQVACWYNTKTPGYLLNFSRQQFLFTLKDQCRQEKYLWLAERISDKRILLYCTHSPIHATVSSVCYQQYREQLIHQNMNPLLTQ